MRVYEKTANKLIECDYCENTIARGDPVKEVLHFQKFFRFAAGGGSEELNKSLLNLLELYKRGETLIHLRDLFKIKNPSKYIYMFKKQRLLPMTYHPFCWNEYKNLITKPKCS